ncbi:MAG TPA: hypothetical protein VGM15_09940 [Burkholderiaceae bacterium]
MHLLIGLLIVALVAFVLYRGFAAPAPNPVSTSIARSPRAFAFLSNGNIFLRERGGEVKQLHSDYIQEAMDRRERSRERNSWKAGTSFKVSAGGGLRDFEPADQPIVATSAIYETNGDLLYFLKDSTIGGLFRREAASGKELRLLSRQRLHLSDLAQSPDGTRIAASSMQSDGSSNIALLKADASGCQDATGGDTVDGAPAWIPGVPDRLLFQSAGLARHESGHIVARGHTSILKLDMTSGSVSPILDDARYDFLRPRVDAAGNLLFIRRPYQVPRYTSGNLITDTLLFPFRLLRAIFHYLNFFSLMYTRKPLTSASGPAMQADIKQILLQGRHIDAQKALRSAGTVQGVPSLVPNSWQLVRRNPRGDEAVLATNVASFDIGTDGTVVYSNGQGVFFLDQNGSPSLATSGELVAEVVAAPCM